MSAADMLDEALDRACPAREHVYTSHRDGVQCKFCGDPFWKNRCPNPDCRDGKVILNPEWPKGDLPYCENCSECGGVGTVDEA